MTYDEYDRLPGIRASDLKRMRESPLHYRTPPEDDDTPAKAVLRAIHCRVMEGEAEYFRRFVIFPGTRRGKAYDDCIALHPGAVALNARESGVVEATSAAILAHPDAGPFFTSPGQSELTIQWVSPYTSMPCKARIDRLVRDKTGRWTLIDLKSYGTTDGRQVGAMAARLGAFIQLAHYEEGLAVSMGISDARILLVSAETRPPYDVGVFELDRGADLGAAQSARDQLMARVAECVDLDFWPGRNVGIQPLRRSAWAVGEVD